MQKITTKNSVRILLVIVLGILVGLGTMAKAQDKSVNESKSISMTTLENGGLKLKIVTRNGADQKIFEKTYENAEDMKNDPELEEYGIDSDNFSFGGNGRFNFKSGGNTIYLNHGFGNSFWNDDEDDHGMSFGISIDSLHSKLRSQMKSFRNGAYFIDLDSLRNKFTFDIDSLRGSAKGFSFGFGDDDDNFWMNGEEFENIEELREALREKFKDMDFDFDFGSSPRAFSFFKHSGDDDDSDGNFKIVTRAKVFVRSASKSDKEKVGADKMDELEIRDISFYPNPSDGRFTVDIRTGNDQPVMVKVIDPNGSVVYERNDQSSSGEYSFRVDLSGKRKGIYLLQVVQNNSSLTKRVIIE